MKSNKGITLVSLVVYVIGITIIFSIVATLTISFNKNSRYIENQTNNSREFTRLNMYLVNDLTKENITAKVEDNKLKINNGEIIYTISGDGIYRNKVKLCSNVEENSTSFTQETIYDKTKIKLEITIGKNGLEQLQKTMEYVI